jgi:subtilisin-like proprotein convertase family protein
VHVRRTLLVVTVASLAIAAAATAGVSASPDGTAPQVIHRDTNVLGSAPEGDQDVLAEAGEPFTFSVTIRNVGDTPVTGISGTVSPAGFSVQQGTSSYPDLPPGATAANATPFAGTLPADAACGGGYRATLAVNTQQGSFSIPVVVPVGTLPSQRLWSSSTPVPIPDNATVESPLTLTADPNTGAKILDLNVRIGFLGHSWVGDLLISLVPAGSSGQINLIDHRGAGANFNNTVIDDEAGVSFDSGSVPFEGSFRPDSTVMLAAVDGLDATGVWRLRITDNVPSDTGTLSSWSISATLGRCNRPPQITIRSYPVVFVRRPLTVSATVHDFDGQIVGQAWDLDNDGQFDDGTDTRATKTFATAGRKTIRIRAVDSGGNAAIGSRNVTVLRTCLVPRVVGMTLRAAKAKIRRAGCRVGRIRRVRSRRVGRVVGQKPKARAGWVRAGGWKVDLVVGRR